MSEEQRYDYDFYMLFCKDCPDDFYVGSSENIHLRMNCHASDCHNPNAHNYHLQVYQFIRDNGGWENWNYKIIHQEKDLSRKEAKIREQSFIDDLKPSLNTRNAFTDKKEYDKKYNEEHKEEIKEYHKNYYHENWEEIRARVSETITCECGAKIRRGDIATHRRTIKHQNLMNNL